MNPPSKLSSPRVEVSNNFNPFGFTIPQQIMKNRQYCFHLRDALSGDRIIGGMITAPNMEAAATKVCASNQILHEKIQVFGVFTHTEHHHLYGGRRVYLHITAHPEYLAQSQS